jgi:hypothetical protein
MKMCNSRSMATSREAPQLPEGVLAVRLGPGANCSSIGSIVDLLFGTAVVGGVLYASIAAALADAKSQSPAALDDDASRPDDSTRNPTSAEGA